MLFCPSFVEYSDNGGCGMCRAVCQSFPFEALESEYGVVVPESRFKVYCIRHDDFLRIVSRRRGWDEYVSQHPTTLLEKAITLWNEEEVSQRFLTDYFNISSSKENAIVKMLVQKYYSRCEKFEEVMLHYVHCFSPDSIFPAAIDRLISIGFSPKKVPAKILRNSILGVARGPALVDKDFYQWLSSRGFNLDERIFIPVRRNEVKKLEAILSL